MTKPESYLKSLLDPNGYCDLGRFTVINNALRGEEELGEIVAASGKQQVIDIVTISPERMALLYTVAVIQTEIKINDELHLNKAVDTLYNKFVLPSVKQFYEQNLVKIQSLIEKELNQSIKRFENNSLNKDNFVDQLVQETYSVVQDRVDKGLYIPGKYHSGENINSVVEKIVKNKIFNSIIHKQIKDIAEKTVNEAIEHKESISINSKQVPLERLSLHVGSERNTFMIAGPPACGKGSITAMMEIEARKSGIEFNDVVKVNTDFYRNIVSTNQKLGPNIIMHAYFNNDELAMITDLTVEILKEKITKGSAPHSLLDTVSFKQSKIDFGTLNDGSMRIKIMTLKPEIALERAEKRGKATGRFVPTNYMLEAHQKLGESINSILKNNIDKNIQIEVYDNEVRSDELPNLVQSMNLKDRMVEIYNINKYTAINDRKFINTEAYNASYIYPIDHKSDYNQIKALYDADYQILFHEDIPSYIPRGKTSSTQSRMNKNVPNIHYDTPAQSSMITTGGPNIEKPTSNSPTMTRMATSVFDNPLMLQTQMKLAQLLFILGTQIIDAGKISIENLRSKKINKKDFADSLNSLSTEIKKDIRKLDDLSDKLKQENFTNKNFYRDKIIDLSAEALEIKDIIKKFKHKETIPEIRLRELEEKTKSYNEHVKNLQKDLSKAPKAIKENPELINNIGELARLNEKYKNMSKEAKILIKDAKGEIKTKKNMLINCQKLRERPMINYPNKDKVRIELNYI